MLALTYTCARCGVDEAQRTGRGRKFTRCLACRTDPHERRLADIMAASPCRQDHTCQGCEAIFRPKRTDRTRYCSRECAFKTRGPSRRSAITRTARALERKVSAAPVIAERKALRKIARGMGASIEAQRVLAARRRRASLPCLHCGNPLGSKAMGSGHTRYCSAACARRSPALIEAKRTARKARKARLRGVQVEPVNPTRVFERDGWRCHLCGGKTVKGRRGSYHPKAPELDHIVPLAKGGPHSYANTACAHRSCNAAKSDNIMGQPSLLAA